MTGRLTGKVALVTGVASGIGRETAILFAREGAQVIAADRDLAGAEAIVAQLPADGGGWAMSLDVSQEGDWIAAIDQVRERAGRLDILVNNAGIVLPACPITDVTLADWRRVMAVNADGVFLGTRTALPLMRESGAGSIVNVSSIAGIRPSPNAAAYAASKGAVRLFTKAVALECAAAKDGIRVNSVHPGLTDTALLQGLRPASSPDAEPAPIAFETLASTAVPLGRLGRVDEVAAGILWLAGDESSYVTGAELVIDGGTLLL